MQGGRRQLLGYKMHYGGRCLHYSALLLHTNTQLSLTTQLGRCDLPTLHLTAPASVRAVTWSASCAMGGRRTHSSQPTMHTSGSTPRPVPGQHEAKVKSSVRRRGSCASAATASELSAWVH